MDDVINTLKANEGYKYNVIQLEKIDKQLNGNYPELFAKNLINFLKK